MKNIILFVSMLALVASCSITDMESEHKTYAPDIFASFENNDTKTTLTTDEDGVGTIWWSPFESINIFFNSSSKHYISKNGENATIATFRTTESIEAYEAESNNIWGLYPYDSKAICDGSSVTTTIPSSQIALAGTFNENLFTSLGHSTNVTMTFYNVLGGIKFSLSRNDIKRITFKGNNNEALAGNVKLSMDSERHPTATIIEGKESITLIPNGWKTFAKNTDYYIVMLPTILSNGFTMTFETANEIGNLHYSSHDIEIKRSVFMTKENIDLYATFSPLIPTHLDQSIVSYVSGAGDNCSSTSSSYPIMGLWDGSGQSAAGYFFASNSGDPMPQWLTFDLHVNAVIKRIHTLPRIDYNIWSGAHPRDFEFWGSIATPSTKKTTEEDKDKAAARHYFEDCWFLLGRFQQYKPSGYASDGTPGAYTAEDRIYFNLGNDFEIDNMQSGCERALEKIRYFRIVFLDSFSTYEYFGPYTPSRSGAYGQIQFGDIMLYGDIESEQF